MAFPAYILVAEDEPASRRLYEAVLTRAGHRVKVVTSAEDAIAALETERFDLLVTDKNMPGLDGLALLKHVQLRYPALRTVLITGYPSWESRVEAVENGATAYMTKPF